MLELAYIIFSLSGELPLFFTSSVFCRGGSQRDVTGQVSGDNVADITGKRFLFAVGLELQVVLHAEGEPYLEVSHIFSLSGFRKADLLGKEQVFLLLTIFERIGLPLNQAEQVIASVEMDKKHLADEIGSGDVEECRSLVDHSLQSLIHPELEGDVVFRKVGVIPVGHGDTAFTVVGAGGDFVFSAMEEFHKVFLDYIYLL